MKTWQRYWQYLDAGEWHIHTSYVDGANTVAEYCLKARELGIPLLAFTEHVRAEPDYDFKDYLGDIARERAKNDLTILAGCEAKVLPGGKLDISRQVLNRVEYVIFAFHSFPNDLAEYLSSLKAILKNPYINTWAHPGLWAAKNEREILYRELAQIFELMRNNDVLLEINSHYRLPPPEWLEMAEETGVSFVRGSDVHKLDDLKSSNTAAGGSSRCPSSDNS